MSNGTPRCGCCHSSLWSDSERGSGVCHECVRITRFPERYRNDPDVDITLVRRRVNSIHHAARKQATQVAR